tara:strand:+ start:2116 stop:2889 length:774 start_codon:yes stop_codon:yes gene_type:complete
MSIKTKSLSYAINEKRILEDISIEILPGEICTVIGPNGSGKSTLLKIISGDIKSKSKRVYYEDIRLTEISLKKRALIRSVMSQSQAIMFDYTVKDVLSMGWLGFQLDKDLDKYEILLKKIVKDCDIELLLNQKFNVLSEGEQRRIHFARTLVQLNYESKCSYEKYLFLDEPTANLDLFWEINFMQIITKIAKMGIGVFLVLHDLDLAFNFSDKIALINDGMLRNFGTPKEVMKNDILSSVYKTDIRVDFENKRVNYY